MKNYKVFDAHCDTLSFLVEKGQTFAHSTAMVKHSYLKKYSAYLQTFACFVSDSDKEPFQKVLSCVKLFEKEVENQKILHIKTKSDLQKVFEQGKIGGLLALENCALLGERIENVHYLYSLGFRMLGLTWNGNNCVGSGVYGEQKGLTDFGKKVVIHAQKLGMVVDLSHINEQGFWDMVEVAKKPIICSHSNAKSVHFHLRNLTDEQIKAVIKTGGVVGVNFYSPFLSDKSRASQKDIIKHIERICGLGGQNSVGIGSDFDGIKICAKGICKASKVYKLFNELERLGYSSEMVQNIAYKNFQSVLYRILI